VSRIRRRGRNFRIVLVEVSLAGNSPVVFSAMMRFSNRQCVVPRVISSVGNKGFLKLREHRVRSHFIAAIGMNHASRVKKNARHLPKVNE
jgi:hypothetical protein